MNPTHFDSPLLSPWRASFWRAASGELRCVRTLVLAALFLALAMAIGRIFIPLPVLGGQRIYFTFLVTALGGVLYGPAVGMLGGMVGDLIGGTLFPTGPFFFGYTLTAMVGPLLYGLFLYRARLSIVRIALCKLSVNVIANIVLNSLWSSMLGGNDWGLLMLTRAPKNLLLWPLEVLMIVLILRAVVPFLQRQGLVARGAMQGTRIPWL